MPCALAIPQKFQARLNSGPGEGGPSPQCTPQELNSEPLQLPCGFAHSSKLLVNSQGQTYSRCRRVQIAFLAPNLRRSLSRERAGIRGAPSCGQPLQLHRRARGAASDLYGGPTRHCRRPSCCSARRTAATGGSRHANFVPTSTFLAECRAYINVSAARCTRFNVLTPDYTCPWLTPRPPLRSSAPPTPPTGGPGPAHRDSISLLLWDDPGASAPPGASFASVIVARVPEGAGALLRHLKPTAAHASRRAASCSLCL